MVRLSYNGHLITQQSSLGVGTLNTSPHSQCLPSVTGTPGWRFDHLYFLRDVLPTYNLVRVSSGYPPSTQVPQI